MNVALHPPKKEKIGPKIVDCVFIGYAQIVVHIDFLCMILQYQIFTRILTWSLGICRSSNTYFHINPW